MTNISDGEYYSYSVDNDFDGNVHVTLRQFEGDDLATKVEWKIPPSEIGYVIAQLANHGNQALRTVGRQMQRGDCKRCKNIRMVNVEKNGHTMAEHCPDCSSEDISVFTEYPRIGGGMTDRRTEKEES